jgi:hypothetical protein
LGFINCALQRCQKIINQNINGVKDRSLNRLAGPFGTAELTA